MFVMYITPQGPHLILRYACDRQDIRPLDPTHDPMISHAHQLSRIS